MHSGDLEDLRWQQVRCLGRSPSNKFVLAIKSDPCVSSSFTYGSTATTGWFCWLGHYVELQASSFRV